MLARRTTLVLAVVLATAVTGPGRAQPVQGIAATPDITLPAPPTPPPRDVRPMAGWPPPGGGDQQAGPGGPRPPEDRIDLSVCDLETFDFDKCLGS